MIAERLLRLTLASGAGPVLVSRLLETFGSVDAVLGASAADLQRVPGIGGAKAGKLAAAFSGTGEAAEKELERAVTAGVTLIARGEDAYPALLSEIPSAPALLYVRGGLRPDAYRVGVVGSRACTAYGIEQAERFGSALAGAGLSVVSGGARGIDTAGHRGAVRAAVANAEPTVAVMGCGLGRTYPPENAELFDRIVDAGGAIVSDLPMETEPAPQNFPARNRLISGLSLGVLVIEAGARSGALITARLAAEEHGREVMAVPGRVDSEASRGSLELLKMGGAHLVTEPGDVLSLLESGARHQHAGSHDAMAESRSGGTSGRAGRGEVPPPQDPDQAAVFAALEEPATADALAGATGLDAGRLRAAITMLEITGRVGRDGLHLFRT